jgi:hypothetical protein
VVDICESSNETSHIVEGVEFFEKSKTFKNLQYLVSLLGSVGDLGSSHN